MPTLTIKNKTKPLKEIAAFLTKNLSRKAVVELVHETAAQLSPPKRNKAEERRQATAYRRAFKNLELLNKQSIVDLLFLVQEAYVSCRRAATEIQTRIPQAHKELGITRDMLQKGRCPVTTKKTGGINSVLACLSDKAYCPSNTYIPRWMVVNAAYYNKNRSLYCGYITLEQLETPEFNEPI